MLIGSLSPHDGVDDGELAGALLPVKAYKVRLCADAEHATGADEPARVGGCHLDGIANAEAGFGGDECDVVFDRRGCAGQIAAASYVESAIRMKNNSAAERGHILAGRKPCKRHNITH